MYLFEQGEGDNDISENQKETEWGRRKKGSTKVNKTLINKYTSIIL